MKRFFHKLPAASSFLLLIPFVFEVKSSFTLASKPLTPFDLFFLFPFLLKLKNIIFLTAYHTAVAVQLTGSAFTHISHSFWFFTPLKLDNPHIGVCIPTVTINVGFFNGAIPDFRKFIDFVVTFVRTVIASKCGITSSAI